MMCDCIDDVDDDACRMQAAVNRLLLITSLELNRQVILVPRQVAPLVSMPLCSWLTIHYNERTLHKVYRLPLLLPLSFIDTHS